MRLKAIDGAEGTNRKASKLQCKNPAYLSRHLFLRQANDHARCFASRSRSLTTRSTRALPASCVYTFAIHVPTHALQDDYPICVPFCQHRGVGYDGRLSGVRANRLGPLRERGTIGLSHVSCVYTQQIHKWFFGPFFHPEYVGRRRPTESGTAPQW